jgi:hypothetical protein
VISALMAQLMGTDDMEAETLDYTDDTVCKSYLCGACPNELLLTTVSAAIEIPRLLRTCRFEVVLFGGIWAGATAIVHRSRASGGTLSVLERKTASSAAV